MVMKNILCRNKILFDVRPAEQVVSPDTLVWIRAMVSAGGGTYEDQFHQFFYESV